MGCPTESRKQTRGYQFVVYKWHLYLTPQYQKCLFLCMACQVDGSRLSCRGSMMHPYFHACRKITNYWPSKPAMLLECVLRMNIPTPW
eukprot:19731_3